MKYLLFVMAVTMSSGAAQAFAADANINPCDGAARKFLELNASYKIEDSSKGKDFHLTSSHKSGDAGTSTVTLTYTDPSDDSTYKVSMFGEGCALISFSLAQ